ncbi:MAG: restriction endonuclease subunit S [Bacteroidetes bacterium]|nr:MAG: restriction endonuclease subunit S [Bacteroidota bacterium]
MEKTTRNHMVILDLKHVSIDIEEVENNHARMEASVFNVDARNAVEVLRKCKFPLAYICGENGLAKAFVVGRFKRNYVNANTNGALGFLGSSEMLELRPSPHKFIVPDKKFDNFKVLEGWLLLSCSGTIGNPIYISKTLKNYIFSQHSLRVVSKEDKTSGYLYAYLGTEIGNTLVKSNNYGAVIQHIEPEHLAKVPIPNPPDEIKQAIHAKVMDSVAMRDKYNELIDKAENLLKEELHLPPLHELTPEYFEIKYEYNTQWNLTSDDVKVFEVDSEWLQNRFDGSFHVPVVSKIIDVLLDYAEAVKPLENFTQSITLPTRFKRNYVENKEYGMLLIGGKQITELAPSTEKYISITANSKQLQKELRIKENTILITRSGTIGKTTLAPKYWENWIPSDHIIRINTISNELAGFIYLWLASEYGQALVKRYTYGAVIDEVEPLHLAQVPIPLLKDKDKQKKINDLVLEANQYRTKAFEFEREAINMVNEQVIFVEE